MAGNAEAGERKTQLIAELHRSRENLSTSLGGLRDDLNVGRHLRQSISRQKTGWLTGAAITGCVLSLLPFRKKKPKPRPNLLTALPFFKSKSLSPKEDGVTDSAKSGLALALFGFLASILKPLITSLLTRKLTEYATGLNHRHRSNGAAEPSLTYRR